MIIEQILTTKFILMALSISAIVFVLRKVGEYFLHNKESRFWKDLVLPVAPVLVGICFGAYFSLIMEGLVAGMFSAGIYKVIRGLIKPYLGKNLPQGELNEK